MTQVKITTAATPFLWEDLSGYAEVTDATPEVMTFASPLSKYVLTVKGDALQYDNGMLIDGRVESLTLRNADGDVALKVNGFYDARELGIHLALDADSNAFESFLYGADDTFSGSKVDDLIFGGAGDDTILGRGGSDDIDGGDGDDILTGGVGKDVFYFQSGLGSDTVTDFDATGGPGRHDTISTFGMDFEDLDIRKAGDDVLIDLGGNDVIRLLDVKLKDLDTSDFEASLPLTI